MSFQIQQDIAVERLAQCKAAQTVVNVYRAVERFDTPRQYLRILTEALDNLCAAHDVKPPERVDLKLWIEKDNAAMHAALHLEALRERIRSRIRDQDSGWSGVSGEAPAPARTSGRSL